MAAQSPAAEFHAGSLDRHSDDEIDLPLIQRAHDHVIVQGAREHNLKNLDLTLPKRSLVVFTGPSGSGKSSLAFDTIYAEGRRRYVESLSTYARQFLGQVDKPDFDQVLGLSPTISIEQKTTSNNPRSTVGTITEIYDHLRVLYAKLGHQHCHQCGAPVTGLSSEAIVERVMELEPNAKAMILAPKVRNRKGEFRDLFEAMRKKGFARARIDGEFIELDQVDKLAKTYKHDIDIVIDRVIIKDKAADRIAESVSLALREGDAGACIVAIQRGEDELEEHLYSTQRSCVECGIAFPELTHQSFSFNSPIGMCMTCRGIGSLDQITPERLVVDEALSIHKGALAAIGLKPGSEANKKFKHKRLVKPVWKALHDVSEKMNLDFGPAVAGSDQR